MRNDSLNKRARRFSEPAVRATKRRGELAGKPGLDQKVSVRYVFAY
jgi:hypothetical protein